MDLQCAGCGAAAQVTVTRRGIARGMCLPCFSGRAPAGLSSSFFLHLCGGVSAPAAAGLPSVAPDTRCEGCGLTYGELHRDGLMGCPRCYESFAAVVRPALRLLHGVDRP
jgi:hypothetical protein